MTRQANPLTWKISGALAKATSLHQSCVYTHLLLLESTTLPFVQVKVGGILGRHCNIIMLQHGPPGEGKSVALWLDLQCLYKGAVRAADKNYMCTAILLRLFVRSKGFALVSGFSRQPFTYMRIGKQICILFVFVYAHLYDRGVIYMLWWRPQATRLLVPWLAHLYR